MGKEGTWLIDPETNQAEFFYWDELDAEQLGAFLAPVGGFCYEASRFQRLPLPPVPYYIKDWLPMQGKALIYAPPKSGKTFLSTQIARCIGSGEPLLGIPTSPGRVLMLQFEMGMEVWQARINSTGQSYENVYVGTNFSLKIDTHAGQAILINALKAVEPQVLILDPLYKSMSKDENETKDMRDICDFLDSLIEAFKCSILLIHHSGKDTSRGARGSSVIDDWVDSCIRMKKTSKNGDCLTAELSPQLLRHAPLLDEPIKIILDHFEFALAEQDNTLADRIMAFSELGEFSPKDILETGVCQSTTLYKTLAQLVEQELLTKTKRGRYDRVMER